jgi:stalled ribosome rescue protein Dom34
MTMFHAVVRIDHHSAHVMQFNADAVHEQRLKDHSHPTAQHGSAVRSEHEFFRAVCDALAGIPEVLVAGTKTSLADFRHYVEKHRPALVPNLVGYEVVDHPSDKQLVALAREWFLRSDRMRGVPTPS